jgi:hypothetical protein
MPIFVQKDSALRKYFAFCRQMEPPIAKMVLTTLVAIDELHSLGIGIRGLADDHPFWDTNAFGLKRKFSTSILPWLIIQPFSMV